MSCIQVQTPRCPAKSQLKSVEGACRCAATGIAPPGTTAVDSVPRCQLPFIWRERRFAARDCSGRVPANHDGGPGAGIEGSDTKLMRFMQGAKGSNDPLTPN